MNTITEEKKETLFFAIRIGAFLGMLSYYIPLLLGFILIESLAIIVIQFLLSPLAGAFLGVILALLLSLNSNKSPKN